MFVGHVGRGATAAKAAPAVTRPPPVGTGEKDEATRRPPRLRRLPSRFVPRRLFPRACTSRSRHLPLPPPNHKQEDQAPPAPPQRVVFNASKGEDYQELKRLFRRLRKRLPAAAFTVDMYVGMVRWWRMMRGSRVRGKT